MLLTRTKRKSRRKQSDKRSRLTVERLETRTLLNANLWPEPNDTVSTASALVAADNFALDLAGAAVAIGSIGDGQSGAADVDWYHFQLTSAAEVSLTIRDQEGGQHFTSALSLYNADLFNFNDWDNPQGYRLLAQVNGADSGGYATLVCQLGPGSYYVAVSGFGNFYFSPVLANSGLEGMTGDYELVASATPIDTAGELAVLAIDVSPFGVRVDFSGDPANPWAFLSDEGAQLFDSNGAPVPIEWWKSSYSYTVHELVLVPSHALAPGEYTLQLAGWDAGGPWADPQSFTFQLTVGEGAQADDTIATAHDLGNVTEAGIIHVRGFIGDDTYYSASSWDPADNPGNDVDLYRFEITGEGRFSLIVEVSAGRIGSPLNPGVSLFRYDESDQRLHFVAGNDDTGNPVLSTDGAPILFSDSVLYVGVKAGVYYLAVSSTGNVPIGVMGMLPGEYGIFDPNDPLGHNGTAGFSTGAYVLSFIVQPSETPPKVVSASIAEGEVLDAPPAKFTIRFSKPVDLQQLVYQSWLETFQGGLAAVTIQGPNDAVYYPRLSSFDANTFEAVFVMLQALPLGEYQLRLSGTLGIADLAGNPLVGNNDNGDYVINFTVEGAQRGTNGDPLVWTDQESNDSLEEPQNLGVLFPLELEAGVTIQRDFSQTPVTGDPDTRDYFRFQVLQAQYYRFGLTVSGMPSGVGLAITEADGTEFPTYTFNQNQVIQAFLTPGAYVLRVGSWDVNDVVHGSYQVSLTLLGSADSPGPLTVGPAPAVRLRLATAVPPPPPADFSASNSSEAPSNLTSTDTSTKNLAASNSNNNEGSGTSFSGSTDSNNNSNSTTLTSTTTVAAATASHTSVTSTTTSTGSSLGIVIPSDLVASLTAGPIGGIRINGQYSPTSPAEQAIAQRLDLGSVEQVLRLTILTQPAGNDQLAPNAATHQLLLTMWDRFDSSDLFKAVDSYFQDLKNPWDKVRDLVFSMKDILVPPPLPDTEIDAQPSEESSEPLEAESPDEMNDEGEGPWNE